MTHCSPTNIFHLTTKYWWPNITLYHITTKFCDIAHPVIRYKQGSQVVCVCVHEEGGNFFCKAGFCCPLWLEVSSLFYLWPASLGSKLCSFAPLTPPSSDVMVHWPHPEVHLCITAERWEVKPLQASKNNIFRGCFFYSLKLKCQTRSMCDTEKWLVCLLRQASVTKMFYAAL